MFNWLKILFLTSKTKVKMKNIVMLTVFCCCFMACAAVEVDKANISHKKGSQVHPLSTERTAAEKQAWDDISTQKGDYKAIMAWVADNGVEEGKIKSLWKNADMDTAHRQTVAYFERIKGQPLAYITVERLSLEILETLNQSDTGAQISAYYVNELIRRKNPEGHLLKNSIDRLAESGTWNKYQVKEAYKAVVQTTSEWLKHNPICEECNGTMPDQSLTEKAKQKQEVNEAQLAKVQEIKKDLDEMRSFVAR